jgi:hypothetical protein
MIFLPLPARRRPQTGHVSNYSKLKVRNVLKQPKKFSPLPSHHRMKKLLLAGMILTAGLGLAPAGINISIGIPLPPLPPLPRPAVVVHQPRVVYAPPVVVAPPVYRPRVAVSHYPPPVYYYYQPHPGHGHYKHHPGRGHQKWSHHSPRHHR